MRWPNMRSVLARSQRGFAETATGCSFRPSPSRKSRPASPVLPGSAPPRKASGCGTAFPPSNTSTRDASWPSGLRKRGMPAPSSTAHGARSLIRGYRPRRDGRGARLHRSYRQRAPLCAARRAARQSAEATAVEQHLIGAFRTSPISTFVHQRPSMEELTCTQIV
jgi:hypothetical protein